MVDRIGLSPFSRGVYLVFCGRLHLAAQWFIPVGAGYLVASLSLGNLTGLFSRMGDGQSEMDRFIPAKAGCFLLCVVLSPIGVCSSGLSPRLWRAGQGVVGD